MVDDRKHTKPVLTPKRYPGSVLEELQATKAAA